MHLFAFTLLIYRQHYVILYYKMSSDSSLLYVHLMTFGPCYGWNSFCQLALFECVILIRPILVSVFIIIRFCLCVYLVNSIVNMNIVYLLLLTMSCNTVAARPGIPALKEKTYINRHVVSSMPEYFSMSPINIFDKVLPLASMPCKIIRCAFVIFWEREKVYAKAMTVFPIKNVSVVT